MSVARSGKAEHSAELLSENLVTARELREFLQISERHLRNLMKRGLPCITVGATYRFSRQEVVAWLRSRQKR